MNAGVKAQREVLGTDKTCTSFGLTILDSDPSQVKMIDSSVPSARLSSAMALNAPCLPLSPD